MQANIDLTERFGLKERDVQTLYAILRRFPEVKRVHIFGSRAKGTYSQGSDIDLAIMNDDVSNETVRCIKSACDESSLPYMVDVLHTPSLRNNDVKAHIERVGTVFYEL